MKKRKPSRWVGDYGLYAIFGFPLSHTFSPQMHNAAFQKLGLQNFYIDIPVAPARFRGVVKKIIGSRHTADRRGHGAPPLLDGFNLTVPHKEMVARSLSSVDPVARHVGAVNTVVRRGKRYVGYNTDVYGFTRSLKRGFTFSPRGKSVLILGAGGAARACVYGLLKEGARRILIANRTLAKARKLAKTFSRFAKKSKTTMFACRLKDVGAGFPRRLAAPLRTNGQVHGPEHFWRDVDLVVNATSLGLKPGDPLPINLAALPRKKLLVMDLIYNPSKTKLLINAARRGYRTMNGLGMLLFQGARAFEIWTGRRAPISVMEKALREAVA